MSEPQAQTRLTLSRLDKTAPTPFTVEPSAEARAELKKRLGLDGLRKLRLQGEIRPLGAKDWQLEAMLGATVVQPCVVTLEPVTTRIDASVLRTYRADYDEPTEAEAEMPEDESEEPLPVAVDLAQILEEALALNLPAFPKAEGAGIGTLSASPAGAEPFEAEQQKPFAALEALKKSLDE